MNRRRFLQLAGAALAADRFAVPAVAADRPAVDVANAPADLHLEIAPLALEIAPGKVVHTVAYNGRVPGPLIRWPEGKPIAVDVTNRSDSPEIVHWHGQWLTSQMDGAMEEGSPMIAAGATLRYAFTPQPAGFRWYHTHTYAGHDLKKGLYSGQFGCFYVEPRENPGAYDQEIFLTLHDWNAYMGGGADASMDAAYDYSTINDRMLGHGDPIRVRAGQRVLFHVLNASATVTHWLALAGHACTVIAADGNAVPRPATMPAVRLAPAERLDILVTMNRPGVWIFGETRSEIRKAGMGIVIEYEGQQGVPRWIEPPETEWDYRRFAMPSASSVTPDERIPLLFESKFEGHGEFDAWTINGKSWPKTDAVTLVTGKRYRLVMTNKSTDDHPVHLHRHTFEVAGLGGKPLSGLRKDVVVVDANTTAEIDFTASHPGPTLFHCHQQTHMDFGFMMLFRYA
ncbi:multicopper oxidase family protein [Paracidobacterium acidisoli]|uniref:Copper oxidase n=1 Tax=Paracidobacterium acidisoli TaxID=2303751 RepID=A0A372IU44_9BACT|nr:multicopper oxidase domain-containing protein [Paracidobacterium acidisoli]MBT9329907.1 multicopper oxidase domain-containing protein [Paracidobacterium acidisoli]